LCLSSVTSELQVLSDVFPDKEVIKKLLHDVPGKLEQVAISMETLHDLNTLTIEEAVGLLHAVELLTEEEWMACMESRDGSGSKSETHRGGVNDDDGKNRGGKAGGEQKSQAGWDDLCDYCGKKGHWAKECHMKKRDEAAQAHVAQGAEEEQSLLLAQCVTLDSTTSIINPTPMSHPSSSSAPRHTVPSSPTAPRRIIHIEDQKVFTDPGPAQEGNHARWVLDTGATNHMTGSRDIFAELNLQIRDTIKFSDGFVTKIEGRGSIILACKNGRHHTLTGVYYIPCLRASIISLG
jgi:hypothetical protein